MPPILPQELVILAKAKQAQYEKEAERDRLLNEARGSTGLRADLALLLYGLAQRLAPEVRFKPQRPRATKPFVKQ